MDVGGIDLPGKQSLESLGPPGLELCLLSIPGAAWAVLSLELPQGVL